MQHLGHHSTDAAICNIEAFGGLDSTLHALEHYIQLDNILEPGLKLMLRLIDNNRSAFHQQPQTFRSAPAAA